MFEVGKKYKEKGERRAFSVIFIGDTKAFVRYENDYEETLFCEDYEYYEEIKEPKVEIVKMYAHYNNVMDRPYYSSDDSFYNPDIFTNEPFYLTFTDGKLTGVSLTNPEEKSNV